MQNLYCKAEKSILIPHEKLAQQNNRAFKLMKRNETRLRSDYVSSTASS